MLKLLSTGLAISMGVSLVSAQSQHVVPTGQDYATRQGEGGILEPFSGLYFRTLEVYRDSGLGFQAGTILELAWRRDGGATTYVQGVRNLIVRLGHTTHAPENLPALFSQAAPSLTEVFRGQLNLPRVDSNHSSSPYPWSVVVKLQRPWVYSRASGHLALDVESSTNVNSSWKRDGRGVGPSGRAGTYREIGRGCVHSGNTVLSSLPSRDSMIPGQVMYVPVSNGPRSMRIALNFLGAKNGPPFPIDLTPLGAPGCAVYTEPTLVQTVNLDWNPITGATGAALWPLPANPSLARAKLNSQWLAPDSANRLGLVFSNAVEITLGDPGRPWLVRSLSTSRPNNDFGDLTRGEQGGIVRITVR